jgi:hypothetical protein
MPIFIEKQKIMTGVKLSYKIHIKRPPKQAVKTQNSILHFSSPSYPDTS